jgi:hypothetical protein
MIYLIITTSINTKYDPVNEEHRKKQYINSITTTLNYIKSSSIHPILVENNGYRSTYLDDVARQHGCDIVYTNNNSMTCEHKGVNELEDIKDVIKSYNINDNDMIIKLTGRYCPLNKSFFDMVEKTDHDAFVKFFNICSKQYVNDDCVLGLFAIRCKYLKEFQYECKLSAEVEFARFIRKTIDHDKLNEVDTLSLQCCFAYDLYILNV